MDTDRAIFLISGTQGAGKSTVGRMLAERFNRGVFIDADDLDRFIVSGRAPIEPPLSADAELQLRLRASHEAMLADLYFGAGFNVVIAEFVLGDRYRQFLTEIKSRPLLLVNLVPSLEVVKKRNEARPNKNVFEPWSPILDREIRATMKGIGLWIDNSSQSAEETVDEILRRSGEAAIS
jgi:gluconate kinase